jgi:hypothetical protein
MALVCRLCDENPPIKNSHIMPRFGYERYPADLDRGGSFVELVTLTEHNKQLKRPWFCTVCEKQFGESYATSFIDKLAKNRADSNYDGELLRFATSFSWRACMFDIDEAGQKEQKETILAPALERWRAFLRGDVPSVTPFTQHAFVMEANSEPWDGRMGMEVSYPNNLVITQIGPLIMFGRLKRQVITRQEQWALKQSELSKAGGKLAVLSKTVANYTLTVAMGEVLDSAAVFCKVMGREFERKKVKRRKRQ